MARQLNPREAWIKFPQNIKNMGDVKSQIKFKTKDQIKCLKVNLKMIIDKIKSEQIINKICL